MIKTSVKIIVYLTAAVSVILAAYNLFIDIREDGKYAQRHISPSQWFSENRDEYKATQLYDPDSLRTA